MCGQSIAYNIYATLGHTNPLFMGFLGYQNVNKEINSTEYRKRATDPENPVFSGFSLYSENLSNILKTHENLSVTNTQLTGN